MLRIAFAGALALILSLCAFVYQADARQRHKTYLAHPDCNVTMPCIGVEPSARGTSIADKMKFGAPQKRYRPRVSANRRSIGGQLAVAAEILPHPNGCPRRAFCACGAAVKVFGRPIRALYLAAAWFKFPRAAPSAGMVAVRRHHVFVLEAHLGGNTWLAYDANSGRHQTRRHARSIAGYVIVNPHASNLAFADRA